MPEDFKHVATVTLGSSAASLSFSNIPQTGTDLYIITSMQNTGSSGEWNGRITVNGAECDDYIYLTISDGSRNGTQGSGGYVLNSTSLNNGSSYFSTEEITIYNYAGSTSGNKIIDAISGASKLNAYNRKLIASARYLSSTAITTVTLNAPSGTNFSANSTASLYMITKA